MSNIRTSNADFQIFHATCKGIDSVLNFEDIEDKCEAKRRGNEYRETTYTSATGHQPLGFWHKVPMHTPAVEVNGAAAVRPFPGCHTHSCNIQRRLSSYQR